MIHRGVRPPIRVPDRDAVRDHRRLGHAVLRVSEQFERADAVGREAMATAVRVRHASGASGSAR